VTSALDFGCRSRNHLVPTAGRRFDGGRFIGWRHRPQKPLRSVWRFPVASGQAARRPRRACERHPYRRLLPPARTTCKIRQGCGATPTPRAYRIARLYWLSTMPWAAARPNHCDAGCIVRPAVEACGIEYGEIMHRLGMPLVGSSHIEATRPPQGLSSLRALFRTCCRGELSRRQAASRKHAPAMPQPWRDPGLYCGPGQTAWLFHSRHWGRPRRRPQQAPCRRLSAARARRSQVWRGRGGCIATPGHDRPSPGAAHLASAKKLRRAGCLGGRRSRDRGGRRHLGRNGPPPAPVQAWSHPGVRLRHGEQARFGDTTLAPRRGWSGG